MTLRIVRSAALICAAVTLGAGLPTFALACEDPQPTPQVKSQARPERDRGERKEGERKDASPANGPEQFRDETFRLMDAYLISNLQESLGLTDDQFARALPLVKRMQSERRDRAMRRIKALRTLRKTLNSGTATDGGVAELLKELKGATIDEREGAARNIEALDGVLTPLQQAKYRVFEAEVDSRLRHLLAKAQDKDRPSGR